MKIKKISGIQKKYLTYIMLLLILALFLSCIGVWSYVRNDMAAVIVDKYEFMNEKMGMSMDNLYKNSNEATAECIINDDVQKSLRTKGLEGVERYALGKYFAYVDLDYITEYCYVDNKKTYIRNPIPRYHMMILRRVGSQTYFQMNIQRQNGFGQRTHCLEQKRKHYLWGGTFVAWIMPMNLACFFSRWTHGFWRVC